MADDNYNDDGTTSTRTNVTTLVDDNKDNEDKRKQATQDVSWVA